MSSTIRPGGGMGNIPGGMESTPVAGPKEAPHGEKGTEVGSPKKPLGSSPEKLKQPEQSTHEIVKNDENQLKNQMTKLLDDKGNFRVERYQWNKYGGHKGWVTRTRRKMNESPQFSKEYNLLRAKLREKTIERLHLEKPDTEEEDIKQQANLEVHEFVVEHIRRKWEL